MAEQEFGERLKKYRKEKNLTQQELADLLQVSNKTVSRWESGGGYPDVPMLATLARALGVTIDDLLDEERPVRTLTRADGQNLLSFAFALGGGVLFFLLRLFMPIAVCYLAYLGCMAYGVYLQRYYCYRSRWFRLSNVVMNFSVNYIFATALLVGIGMLVSTATMGTGIFVETMPNQLLNLLLYGPRYLVWGSVLLASLLTAVTAWMVERRGLGNKVRLRLRWRHITFRWLVPSLGALALMGFLMLYFSKMLPPEAYINQERYYYGLLAALVVLCVALFLKKGRRWGLLPTAVLGLGGLLLPRFMQQYAYLEKSKRFMEVTETLSDMYPRFVVATPMLVVAGVVLVLLCLALALVRIEQKPPEE